MLEIRQFEPENVLAIMPREPDKSIALSVPNYYEMAEKYAEAGPAWTGYYGEVPMFCAGIVLLWPGCGEGWAYTSELVNQFPCSFHKSVHKGLNQVAKDYKLRRIQISIPKDHDVSRNWAVHLGFKMEGEMQKYGPDGATYIRYGRIF